MFLLFYDKSGISLHHEKQINSSTNVFFIMKQTSLKTLKVACYIALAGITLWVLFYGIQSYFVLTQGSGEGVINWDSPRIEVKLAIFIASRTCLLVMASLFAAFAWNILKHLKGGTIFNRANVTLLWIMVAVLPIYSFITDNMRIACSTAEHFDLVLTDNPFIYTLVALIVALLYKVAYDAAEEQKLTI